MTKVHMLGTADLGLLDAMMEQLGDVSFFVKDAELRYVAANPATAEIFGLTEVSGLIGRRSGDFLPEHVARHYEDLDAEVLATGRPIRDRLEPFGMRGAAWLLYTRLPVVDLSGLTVGVLTVGRSLQARGGQSTKYTRLARALERLRADPAQPLDVAALARLAGISVSQLERDSRSVLGMTLQSFLHRLRMEMATPLLIETDKSIAEIAQACGYADQSAFTRRFHQVAGMTPHSWRTANRSQPVSRTSSRPH
ncbi:hypothetical protein A9D14_00990 [Croceicoccus marinus]|uniref:HTH araC/xylS-type domain-containing protein n=2 Tax=Croceicoccus marinus TaxID=450378 RepID=A0A1Z1F880_9SPHN|nr:hypothetical protein A9D14_00990 [Croceicoccus marinus]